MTAATQDPNLNHDDHTAQKFDPDAMREKYRIERDKRIRTDGNDQYVEVTGDFAKYVDDPYVEPGFSREPKNHEVDVLLIGGGFGGLQAGARLRDAGVKDICVIEKGGDFGGTWYWNRYPGAQCDIESYIYLPLLEELDYMPSQKYVQAPEILEHSRAIGRHYDLYDQALFQTEVTEMRWDEEDGRWIVSTNRGDKLRARFVAMANGPLNRPKLPGITGINDFKGHTFHTSRWDYEYTGGDSDGGLSKLHDKRVAVIGTGATSVQCVPHLGETAKELLLFQRTPSGIDVRNNAPTDDEWKKTLEPGWHKQRMENFNNLLSGIPQSEDLVSDGWTDLVGKMLTMLRKGADDDAEGRTLAEIMEAANFEKMNEIRARVDELVRDSEVSESLKPYYKMFCKRPCFHDEYLDTFNRPNVTLVDTDGQGVERITERGLVVDGKEYEVDCIIFATGFEVGTDYSRRAGYQIIGRDDLTLTEKWSEGVQTLHGMQSRGFPNCFILGQSQGGFTANYPHMLDELSVHLSYIISHALDNDVRTVEVSEQAESDWVKTIIEKGTGGAVLGGPDCTPGYYNNEGHRNPLAAQASPYGGGPVKFFQILSDWREEGSMDGLELSS